MTANTVELVILLAWIIAGILFTIFWVYDMKKWREYVATAFFLVFVVCIILSFLLGGIVGLFRCVLKIYECLPI